MVTKNLQEYSWQDYMLIQRIYKPLYFSISLDAIFSNRISTKTAGHYFGKERGGEKTSQKKQSIWKFKEKKKTKKKESIRRVFCGLPKNMIEWHGERREVIAL